jgi:hypothetical protein
MYCILFLVLALVDLVAYILNFYWFGKVGLKLTRKLRVETFEKIIRMPVSWFD